MLRVLSLDSQPLEKRDRGFYGFSDNQPPQVDKQDLIQIGRDALYKTSQGFCQHRTQKRNRQNKYQESQVDTIQEGITKALLQQNAVTLREIQPPRQNNNVLEETHSYHKNSSKMLTNSSCDVTPIQKLNSNQRKPQVTTFTNAINQETQHDQRNSKLNKIPPLEVHQVKVNLSNYGFQYMTENHSGHVAQTKNSIQVRSRPKSGNPYSKKRLYNVGEQSRKISEMIKQNTFLTKVSKINEEPVSAASIQAINRHAHKVTQNSSQKVSDSSLQNDQKATQNQVQYQKPSNLSILELGEELKDYELLANLRNGREGERNEDLKLPLSDDQIKEQSIDLHEGRLENPKRKNENSFQNYSNLILNESSFERSKEEEQSLEGSPAVTVVTRVASPGPFGREGSLLLNNVDKPLVIKLQSDLSVVTQPVGIEIQRYSQTQKNKNTQKNATHMTKISLVGQQANAALELRKKTESGAASLGYKVRPQTARVSGMVLNSLGGIQHLKGNQIQLQEANQRSSTANQELVTSQRIRLSSPRNILIKTQNPSDQIQMVIEVKSQKSTKRARYGKRGQIPSALSSPHNGIQIAVSPRLGRVTNRVITKDINMTTVEIPRETLEPVITSPNSGNSQNNRHQDQEVKIQIPQAKKMQSPELINKELMSVLDINSLAGSFPSQSPYVLKESKYKGPIKFGSPILQLQTSLSDQSLGSEIQNEKQDFNIQCRVESDVQSLDSESMQIVNQLILSEGDDESQILDFGQAQNNETEMFLPARFADYQTSLLCKKIILKRRDFIQKVKSLRASERTQKLMTQDQILQMKNSFIHKLSAPRDVSFDAIHGISGKHIYTMQEKQYQIQIWNAYLQHISIMKAELSSSHNNGSKSKVHSRATHYVEENSQQSHQILVQLQGQDIIIGKHRNSDENILSSNKVTTELLNINANSHGQVGIMSDVNSLSGSGENQFSQHQSKMQPVSTFADRAWSFTKPVQQEQIQLSARNSNNHQRMKSDPSQINKDLLSVVTLQSKVGQQVAARQNIVTDYTMTPNSGSNIKNLLNLRNSQNQLPNSNSQILNTTNNKQGGHNKLMVDCMDKVSENETLEDKQQFSDAHMSISVMNPKLNQTHSTQEENSIVGATKPLKIPGVEMKVDPSSPKPKEQVKMPTSWKLEVSKSGMLHQIGSGLQTKPMSVCSWLAGPNWNPAPKPQIVCTHRHQNHIQIDQNQSPIANVSNEEEQEQEQENDIIYEDDGEEQCDIEDQQLQHETHTTGVFDQPSQNEFQFRNRSSRVNMRLTNLWSHQMVKGVGNVAQCMTTPVSQLILQQMRQANGVNHSSNRTNEHKQNYQVGHFKSNESNRRQSAQRTQRETTLKSQSSGLRLGQVADLGRDSKASLGRPMSSNLKRKFKQRPQTAEQYRPIGVSTNRTDSNRIYSGKQQPFYPHINNQCNPALNYCLSSV